MTREENLISANEFCLHNNIEISFIQSLQEYGLVELTNIEETLFIDSGRLSEVEKMTRLHYDLNINLEGIDAIINLLRQLEMVQDEISLLRNKLRVYEGVSGEWSVVSGQW